MSQEESRDEVQAYQVLSCIQSYAPDAAAQQQVADIYNKSFADDQDWKKLVHTMVGILHDGVYFGNWPWVGTTNQR